MNTASLELCKELYVLSGWGELGDVPPPDKWYSFGKTNDNAGITDRTSIGRDTHYLNSVPAYDLGFLLRKLPAILNMPDGPHQLHLVKDWFVEYQTYDLKKRHSVGIYKFMADTPEDAACKLAIELFKQGVLQPEVKK